MRYDDDEEQALAGRDSVLEVDEVRRSSGFTRLINSPGLSIHPASHALPRTHDKPPLSLHTPLQILGAGRLPYDDIEEALVSRCALPLGSPRLTFACGPSRSLDRSGGSIDDAVMKLVCACF